MGEGCRHAAPTPCVRGTLCHAPYYHYYYWHKIAVPCTTKVACMGGWRRALVGCSMCSVWPHAPQPAVCMACPLPPPRNATWGGGRGCVQRPASLLPRQAGRARSILIHHPRARAQRRRLPRPEAGAHGAPAGGGTAAGTCRNSTPLLGLPGTQGLCTVAAHVCWARHATADRASGCVVRMDWFLAVNTTTPERRAVRGIPNNCRWSRGRRSVVITQEPTPHHTAGAAARVRPRRQHHRKGVRLPGDDCPKVLCAAAAAADRCGNVRWS